MIAINAIYQELKAIQRCANRARRSIWRESQWGFNFSRSTVGGMPEPGTADRHYQYIWDGVSGGSASGQSSFVERAGDDRRQILALVEIQIGFPTPFLEDYVDNAVATNVPHPPDLSGSAADRRHLSADNHFGSTAVAGVDLSRHLDLYGGSFGISVISNTLNMVAGSVASLQATPQGATINGAGTVTSDLSVGGSVWANSGHWQNVRAAAAPSIMTGRTTALSAANVIL